MFVVAHDFLDLMGTHATRSVAQDVTLGPCDTHLSFFWQVCMQTHADPLPREFHVDIEPAGGGPALATTLLVSVPQFTSVSTGPLISQVDISAFAGSTVRISFEWDFGGGGFAGNANHAELDDVQIVSNPPPGANTPPVASGLPPGGVFTTSVGQTLNATISFDSPEAGQTTSVVVTDGGLPNFSAVSTPGNPATVDITFSPDASQVGGFFPIALLATDDGCPPESTFEPFALLVSCFVASATPMGTPCGMASLSATLPILGSMGTISIDGSVPFAQGTVFQSPNSGSSFLFQGCEIFVSGLNVLASFTTNMSGDADIAAMVPADTMLCGLERVFQALVLSGIGPVTGQGIEVTNAVVIALGATP